jgi:hypothetical protein
MAEKKQLGFTFPALTRTTGFISPSQLLRGYTTPALPAPALPASTTLLGEKANNNNTNNQNTLAPLPFFQKNTETAMQMIGLRPSSSAWTAEHEYAESLRRQQEQEDRNAAYGKNIPFTNEKIVKIVDVLRSCPVGELATRVFRQHTGMGLCWHDAFFMMFFENQDTKDIALQLLKEFFFELEAMSTTSLAFDKKKTNTIAKALRAKHSSALSIGTWELVTVALHRYALLGLLFITESQAEIIKAPVKNSRLLNRRPSIGEMNFDEIHDLLKYGVMRCFDSGASMEGIETFMGMMFGFVKEITEQKIALEVASETLKPTETIGYYFSIQKHPTETSPHGFVGGAHIISLFMCNNQWFLYDNETGVVPLSAEISTAISTEGIKSIQIVSTEDLFKYPITLGNGTIVQAEMPHIRRVSAWNTFNQSEEKTIHALVIPSVSYRMIKVKTTGGRRRTRLARNRTVKLKSKRRQNKN